MKKQCLSEQQAGQLCAHGALYTLGCRAVEAIASNESEGTQ